MIVDHAGGLHQRVADGRADELESALNQVAAHGVGFGCAGWHLSHSSPTILLRLVADKTPEVSVETAELFPDREKRLRILDRCRNLQPVTHDPGVAEEPFHIARVVARDLLRVKSVERFAIILSFLENRSPAQPGLRAFKDQKLKQYSIVMNRHAPFLIVIGNVRFSSCPGTTRHMGSRMRAEGWRAKILREIRLDKSRTSVDVDLVQDRVAGVNESMRCVRRNDDDVARFHLALFVADCDGGAAVKSECDFDVRMLM